MNKCNESEYRIVCHCGSVSKWITPISYRIFSHIKATSFFMPHLWVFTLWQLCFSYVRRSVNLALRMLMVHQSHCCDSETVCVSVCFVSTSVPSVIRSFDSNGRVSMAVARDKYKQKRAATWKLVQLLYIVNNAWNITMARFHRKI